MLHGQRVTWSKSISNSPTKSELKSFYKHRRVVGLTTPYQTGYRLQISESEKIKREREREKERERGGGYRE